MRPKVGQKVRHKRKLYRVKETDCLTALLVRVENRDDRKRVVFSEIEEVSEHERELVQLFNPKTSRYVLVDKTRGVILEQKKTPGKYPNIPTIERKKK